MRRNFSNLVYRLRQSLGDGWLVIEDESISLRTGPDLWVDAWAFESLLASGEPGAALQALELYRGDLLPEFYADWRLPCRVALREKHLALLGRLAGEAEDGQRLEEAFDHYYRMAAEDPLNEAACRTLMRVYARMDRYSFFNTAPGSHTLSAALPEGLSASLPPFATTDLRGAAVGIAARANTGFSIFLPVMINR